MKASKKKLNWYQKNPIVMIWRDSGDISYKKVLDHINENWNVRPGSFTYNRVASVMDQYLSLLVGHYHTKVRKGYVNRNYLKNKFTELTENEISYLNQKLGKGE